MNKQIIDLWIMENINKFSKEKREIIIKKMNTINEEEFSKLCQEEFKEYYSFLAISSCLGFFGIDRFLLKDNIIGTLKLSILIITIILYDEYYNMLYFFCYLFLIIFYIYDLITIKKRIEKYNFDKMVNFFKLQKNLNNTEINNQEKQQIIY